MRDYEDFSYILDQEPKLDLLSKRYFNEMLNRVMPYKMNLNERLQVMNCVYEHALHIEKQTGFIEMLTEYYKISDHVLTLEETVKVMKQTNDYNIYFKGK